VAVAWPPHGVWAVIAWIDGMRPSLEGYGELSVWRVPLDFERPRSPVQLAARKLPQSQCSLRARSRHQQLKQMHSSLAKQQSKEDAGDGCIN